MSQPPIAPPPAGPGARVPPPPARPAPGAAADEPRRNAAARPDVPPAPEPPRRRSALVEGAARLRAASRTEPGRLRAIGGLLAGLLLVFGAVAFWEISYRADAADAAATGSRVLSSDAAEIYRLLADANTTAAVEFLAGTEVTAGVLACYGPGAQAAACDTARQEEPGQEEADGPRGELRDRDELRAAYEEDIREASRLLAAAAASSTGSAEARGHIQRLNEGLPYYTGLVETARAINRQGLPLGGAYLRYANDVMQAGDDSLLSTARRLYELEQERLAQDLERARTWPRLALALGLVALAALVWAQRRHFVRTNRVFSPGLVAATAAAVVLLGWLLGAHAMARAALGDADRNAGRSLAVLNAAWTEALQARGNESMHLVMRGANDDFEESYGTHMTAVAEGPRSLLERARALADDREGREPVEAAIDAVAEWSMRHDGARAIEDEGDYERALGAVIGSTHSAGNSFEAANGALSTAVEHEKEQLSQAVRDGRSALGGLRSAAVVLALLAAAGAALGVGRRLSEYR
ncbi:hypothetical protein RM780_05550 [Streptomyces sp. DSM 44917]|uniref:Secreted protein n=1 Tax=Streptomyces boetiae TaxID=3075541 RepID=A0ABU2L4E0_9ACTN|nr:hypothetical protein [Streptomyces sp. DSM 44917]MDT0306426.1 hypothetical protein [Streptomyces sp. DSM 44917]